MDVLIEGPLTKQGRTCGQILRALPDWFGIPSAVEEYVQQAETLGSFIALADDSPVAILTFKLHFERSAEIVVTGVLPQYHRQGIGRSLLSALEAHLLPLQVDYLQVKTLDPSAESEHYERTRKFFEDVGFAPLEKWPTIWDPGNPCLQMIKHLERD